MKIEEIIHDLYHFPSYVFEGITYKSAGLLFTARPRLVCFPITFRCNSRCQMCNMWKNPDTIKELDLKQIDDIFSSNLFKKVEEMVIHGGEPTLRKDVGDIYKIVTHHCPRLALITSSTNGLSPHLVEKWADQIISAVDLSRIKLIFTVSIDGLQETHEQIRGIPGAFAKALESLQILKKYRDVYPIDVQIITVMQPQNITDLGEIERLAHREQVDITFQPLMIDSFYDNSITDPRLKFSKDQMHEYKQFIKKMLLNKKNPKSLYWKNFLEMMAGEKRNIPCAYDRFVLSLYPTGEVLPCSKENWISFGNAHEKSVHDIWYDKQSKKIRKKMRKEVCPTCTFYCGAEYSLKKEFFTYFGYYLKETLFSNRR